MLKNVELEEISKQIITKYSVKKLPPGEYYATILKLWVKNKGNITVKELLNKKAKFPFNTWTEVNNGINNLQLNPKDWFDDRPTGTQELKPGIFSDCQFLVVVSDTVEKYTPRIFAVYEKKLIESQIISIKNLFNADLIEINDNISEIVAKK